MCLSCSDFKILYRNLSKRLCTETRRLKLLRALGKFLFPLSTKDREMESESGEDPAVVCAR